MTSEIAKVLDEKPKGSSSEVLKIECAAFVEAVRVANDNLLYVDKETYTIALWPRLENAHSLFICKLKGKDKGKKTVVPFTNVKYYIPG